MKIASFEKDSCAVVTSDPTVAEFDVVDDSIRPVDDPDRPPFGSSPTCDDMRASVHTSQREPIGMPCADVAHIICPINFYGVARTSGFDCRTYRLEFTIRADTERACNAVRNL